MVSWFKERRNQIIKNLLIEHAKKVYDTCSASLEYVNKVISDDVDCPYEIILNRVISLERNADVIQTKLSNEISRGYFPPDVRQHLFRLLRSNDLCSNRIKSGSKTIELLRKTDSEIPENIIINYKKLIEGLKQSSKIIWDSIAKLGIDDDEILLNKEIIENLEKEADKIFLEIKEESLKFGTHKAYGNIEMLIEAAVALEMSFDATYYSIQYLSSIIYSARVA